MSIEKNNEQDILEKATRLFKAKFNFYKHLAIYIGIVLLVIIIWATTGTGSTWWIWPLGVWGMGVVAHYVSVFIFPHGMETKFMEHQQPEWEKKRADLIEKAREWEEKQIANNLAKLKKNQQTISDGEKQ